jgi:MATE family multidrug resistance protein
MLSTKQELQQLLRLGAPILVAQFCQTAVGVVDTVMAGNYSANDLAAVALGYSIWLPIMLAMMGLLMSVTPLVAQAMGAKKASEAGDWLQQGLWMALLLGGLVYWALNNVDYLFDWFDVPDKFSDISSQYLVAIACGMPAMALYQSWRSFNEGIERTRIIMYVGIASFLLNIPLNYLFIYGEWGFPQLGGVGCGVASALVFWFSALCLWAYTRWSHHPASQQASRQLQWPQLVQLNKLFWLGLPIAISLFAEVALFAGIALLLAFAGETVIAAHQIALNVSGVVFMVPLSISLAITIRVGFLLGAGQRQEAQFSRKVGQGLSIVCALFNATVLVTLATQIAGFYTPDISINSLAASLLLLAAVYQIPDALQITANGALRGYKDTAVPMLMLVISYWACALPFGWWLSKQDWQGEPLLAHGYWWGLVLGLTVAAILLNGRLRWRERISLTQ